MGDKELVREYLTNLGENLNFKVTSYGGYIERHRTKDDIILWESGTHRIIIHPCIFNISGQQPRKDIKGSLAKILEDFESSLIITIGFIPADFSSDNVRNVKAALRNSLRIYNYFKRGSNDSSPEYCSIVSYLNYLTIWANEREINISLDEFIKKRLNELYQKKIDIASEVPNIEFSVNDLNKKSRTAKTDAQKDVSSLLEELGVSLGFEVFLNYELKLKGISKNKNSIEIDVIWLKDNLPFTLFEVETEKTMNDHRQNPDIRYRGSILQCLAIDSKFIFLMIAHTSNTDLNKLNELIKGLENAFIKLIRYKKNKPNYVIYPIKCLEKNKSLIPIEESIFINFVKEFIEGRN